VERGLQLMVWVEKARDLKDSALGVFLDVEGAFNYTSLDSKSTSLGRHISWM